MANERGLARAEEQIIASSEALRRSLIATFVITLFGGLLLALLTVTRTLRLERELERRLEENTPRPRRSAGAFRAAAARPGERAAHARPRAAR